MQMESIASNVLNTLAMDRGPVAAVSQRSWSYENISGIAEPIRSHFAIWPNFLQCAPSSRDGKNFDQLLGLGQKYVAKSPPTPAAPEKTAAPATSNAGDVWVNTRSGKIWKSGSRYYGKTKKGKFMTEMPGGDSFISSRKSSLRDASPSRPPVVRVLAVYNTFSSFAMVGSFTCLS
jgi:hypothetical protein